MSEMPRLTIGLPVFNGERYLAESLDALLGQSYEDYVLVISDNASTDGTAAICRRYLKQDSRIRYVRQPRNIGAALNHNFLARECHTELFKWASADDLYARDLLERCVATLDEHPEVVLAHSWTAAVDGASRLTQALPYPLTTDSASAPERFHSLLFGAGCEGLGGEVVDGDGVIRADDFYGVIRTDVLHRVRPHDSYYYADRTFMAEIVLQGPFHQTPEWLYFRRDHPERAQHAYPTVRSRCVNLDPRRASRVRHPAVRLLAEYVLGYASAIRRAPLSAAEQWECRRHLLRWLRTHAIPQLRRMARRDIPPPISAMLAAPATDISIDEIVAGRERGVS